MKLRDGNIVISGASSGIGAALAAQLAGKAKTLVLVARRKDRLEALAKRLSAAHPRLKVMVLAKDMTIATQLSEMMSELRQEQVAIDILINNAGVGDECYFHESDLTKLHKIIDLNVKSVVSLTHLVLQQMMGAPKGKGLVFIGSGAGIAWMPGSAVYSASKHFISAFAMNVQSELKPYGVETVLVTPGPVDSEFDKNAGIEGGMKGGPSQNTRISSEQCAADIIRQLDKGKTVIFPGRKLRRLMKLYINLPWAMRKRLLLSDGKKLYRQKLEINASTGNP